MPLSKTTISWTSILSRGVVLSLIWWMLSDGAATSWWIGVPAVLLALGASIVLIPITAFNWLELLRFAPFFLLHSLLGGIDVARRAFPRRIPIAPVVVEYPLRLPPGPAQVFMANTVSLLPGTLVAGLDNNVLNVHVLAKETEFLTELEIVEQRVARIFDTPLIVFKQGE